MRLSPPLVDSASATTSLNRPEETTPFGGVTLMLLKVRLTVVAFTEVYKMGLVGMPRNAVLPTAAPAHEGAALAMMPPPLGEVPLSVKEKIEPSESVIVKGWPPPKTVALL